MLRKLFLCITIVFGCSFVCLEAMASDAVEAIGILHNFDDFNHRIIYVEGEHGQLPETLNAALAPGFQQIGLNEYVSDIAMIEQAACYSKSEMKSFFKKCAKTIKKAKLPQIKKFDVDDISVIFYAKEGQIVCLSQIDDDIASIVVITGTNNNNTIDAGK